MKRVELRSYQQVAVDDIFNRFDKGETSLILPSPTGSGKTEIALAVFQRYRERYNRRARAWFTVGTNTLLRQAELRAIGYGITTGIIQASNTRNVRAPFVVCSVQTLHRRDPARLGKRPDCVKVGKEVCVGSCTAKHCVALRREEFDVTRLKLPDILIVDEAHYAYQYSLRLINAMRQAGRLVLGITATPYAGHMSHYHHSPMIKADSTDDLTTAGFLVPMEVRIAERPLYDVGRGVKPRGRDESADFDKSQLATALHEGVLDDVGGIWQSETESVYGKPVATIVTAPTIAECEVIADKLTSQTGLKWEVSSAGDGSHGNPSESDLLRRFASGETIGLVSPIKLTIGFDAPFASCAMLLRPYATRTPLIQAIGRVLRPYEDKRKALILDFGTNLNRLYDQFEKHYNEAPSEFVDPVNPSGVEYEPGETVCPTCNRVFVGRPRECPQCKTLLVEPAAPASRVEFVMKKLRIGSSVIKSASEFGWRWYPISAYVRLKQSEKLNQGNPVAWYAPNRAAQIEWMMTAPSEHLACFASTRLTNNPRCLVSDDAFRCYPLWASPSRGGRAGLKQLRPLADTAPGNMERSLYGHYIHRHNLLKALGTYDAVRPRLVHDADYLTVRCARCRHFVIVEDVRGDACVACLHDALNDGGGRRIAPALWDANAMSVDTIAY